VCVIDLDDGTEFSPRVWRVGLKAPDGGYDLTLTLSQALRETFAYKSKLARSGVLTAGRVFAPGKDRSHAHPLWREIPDAMG
jgi:hypothetical protein